MLVVKITTRDGEEHYTDQIENQEQLRELAEKHPGEIYEVQYMEMTEEEWRKIPGTSASAEFFGA